VLAAATTSTQPTDPAPKKLRLVAHHPSGVPVHEAAHDRGSFRRVPDGTEVTVLGQAGGNWLHVRLLDGSEGFIKARYVAGPSAPAPASSQSLPDREATCARALERAKGRGTPGVARVATFNVRWFPDGQPGKKAPPGGGTDLGFLACTIATTGAEVVLVQEFKRDVRAQAALRTLLTELDQLTRGSWQARFDDCKNESAQHVGVLFDQKRATPLGLARTLAELNPLGGACTGSLRPGLLQRFRLSNGLVTDAISVHFKSGSDARSHALREKTLLSLKDLKGAAGGSILVGGDLNTMGCDECAAPVSSTAERRLAAQAGMKAGLALVDPKGGCSHYYRGHAGLLDGFWVPKQQKAEVELGGVCADLACRPTIQRPTRPGPASALDRVSDHCPLVLSLPAP
jgi:hypothetical protein